MLDLVTRQASSSGRLDPIAISSRRPPAAARPGGALDQADDQRVVHRAFDGCAARLALALPVVPIADREQRARRR